MEETNLEIVLKENCRLREALQEIHSNCRGALYDGGLPHFGRDDICRAVVNVAEAALKRTG